MSSLREYLDSLDVETREAARGALREHLYRTNVEVWARRKLNLQLDDWQKKLVGVKPGGRAIALCARQVGKTTSCAVLVGHTMLFGPPETTSLFLCPVQRQSMEGIRRVRQVLMRAGAKLKSDNAFSIELDNGSRVLALPGSDDSGIRGLSVGATLVFDEAARVDDTLFEAAMPMVSRFPEARVLVVSTAWQSRGFFHRLWTEASEKDWLKVRADITQVSHMTEEDVELARRSMSDAAFKREFLCQFDETESRFFNPNSIAAMFGRDKVLEASVTSEGNDDDPIVGSLRPFGSLFGEKRV